ncbi:hypothetical protein [Dickeya oryzae]
MNIHEEYSLEQNHNNFGAMQCGEEITHANLTYSMNTVVNISDEIYNKKMTEIFHEILDTEIDY